MSPVVAMVMVVATQQDLDAYVMQGLLRLTAIIAFLATMAQIASRVTAERLPLLDAPRI